MQFLIRIIKRTVMKDNKPHNSFFTSDKDLYLRIKKYKDKEAFLTAYDAYAEDIYRFVYFKVGNTEDAQDITSSVFIKAWQLVQSGQLKDDGNYKGLKNFLYKVARNEAIDYYRLKHSTSFSEADIDADEKDIEDKSQDVFAQAALSLDKDILQKNLLKLKREYRTVLILYYINELSVSEIANITGKTKGSVRVTVFRALKALRELMEE